MKIQADITTYCISKNTHTPFSIHGIQKSFPEIIDFLNIDTLRLSFFSNESPLLSIDDSIKIIQEFNANPISLFLCVHCSDSWADPSHQKIPKSWSFFDKKGLMECFSQYLISIFEKISDIGVHVKFIQVGNEISNGLLWPYLESPHEYVNFIKYAHILCRQYFPNAKLILHTDLSYSSEKALLWYKLMLKRRIDYDLVGLSYYPVWHGGFIQLSTTIKQIFKLTGKKILLCEVGYMYTEIKTNSWFGDWKCDNIPYSPSGQLKYIQELVKFAEIHLNYIYPEMYYWGLFSHNHEDHYPISLFDINGQALPALYELNK